MISFFQSTLPFQEGDDAGDADDDDDEFDAGNDVMDAEDEEQGGGQEDDQISPEVDEEQISEVR